MRVTFFGSHPYCLTDVTAANLWRHLSNMSVIFNMIVNVRFWVSWKIGEKKERGNWLSQHRSISGNIGLLSTQFDPYHVMLVCMWTEFQLKAPRSHVEACKMATVLRTGIFKRIFFNINGFILIPLSPTFVHMCPIDNNTALVRVMAWHWTGNKPVTRPSKYN